MVGEGERSGPGGGVLEVHAATTAMVKNTRGTTRSGASVFDRARARTPGESALRLPVQRMNWRLR
jgi:hypothetical protein